MNQNSTFIARLMTTTWMPSTLIFMQHNAQLKYQSDIHEFTHSESHCYLQYVNRTEELSEDRQ